MNQSKKPVCTIGFIVINVIVFLGLSFIGMTEDAEFMLHHGAMYAPYVVEGHEYYRLITCMFLHFDAGHIMNNMIMLGALGWTLEGETGHIKFFLIYMVSGLAGNLLSLAASLSSWDMAVSAGASGAVFGIMGAIIYVVIRNHGSFGRISGKGLAFMVGLSLYYGFASEGVDNFAHVGGLIGGFFMAVLLYHKRIPRRQNAKNTFGRM
ncbi:MAG: rhomboid family intramembrane serine protease [Hespellia sp.]|nr:rhomboid family intramembrane serine protease [Hespellia sp.]